MIHLKKRDLHPGNVLYTSIPQIGDLGRAVLQSETDDIEDIKGVMPYMAPELFNGGSYSQASDVYAFGIIMWEISSGEKPFPDIIHDKVFALQILKGIRPEITKDTPQFYQDMMQKCWHSNPTQRPTANEIRNLALRWYQYPHEIVEQIDKAEEIRQQDVAIKKVTKIQHPGAIYTSRLLTNISKGK